MIIVFGNQKGGCGKTTNCIQFANYLAEHKNEVIVLDLDFQRSIADRRKEDVESFDNIPNYEVVEVDLKVIDQYIAKIKDVTGYVLIDLPGKIDDDALGHILVNADVIIVPFKYDKLTMDSTGFFISLLKHLETPAKLFFLPNNINKAIRYDTKQQIHDILSEHGKVTPEVHSRVCMERVNTLTLLSDAKEVVKDAYQFILSNI